MKKVLVADDDQTTRVLISEVLKEAGHQVVEAADGEAALKKLHTGKFDLVLLDVWMPRINGLELLARLREEPSRPRVIVMTSDDTPETLLQAVREQAYHYVSKPIDVNGLAKIVRDALAAHPASPSIEVLSAKPYWVELLVPCDIESAERIQSFLGRLKADLSPEVRESVGSAFHELLLNAIEWGGKFDPNRKVRISYLRAQRMLMYRIADPGPGFRFEDLAHAALSNPLDAPYLHDEVREKKGMRPGGFGILLTKGRVDELLYNEAQNEVVFVKYLDPQPAAQAESSSQ
jgi:CheY-like chemotaxis protein/anti-sigma regulatory factor (Ser/Thr protein kinase)